MSTFPHHMTRRSGYQPHDTAEIRKDREFGAPSKPLATLAEKLAEAFSQSRTRKTEQ